MVVTKDKVISLSYELKVNGEVVDQADAQKPLEFIFGHGMLIPKFEENIENKAQGDSYEFTLTSDEGYGPVNKEAVVKLPKEIFKVEGEVADDLLQVGKRLPMLDQEGNQLDGLILEVTDEHVVMDFNHPLAGQDLSFTGTVEAIREATPQEIEHGHVHGSKDESEN